jgi:hypothetical protein
VFFGEKRHLAGSGHLVEYQCTAMPIKRVIALGYDGSHLISQLAFAAMCHRSSGRMFARPAKK